MTDKDHLQHLIKNNLDKTNADFMDIFIEHNSSTAITFEDNKIDRLASGNSSGRGIRTIKGQEIDYAFLPEIKKEEFSDSTSIDEKIALVQKANNIARKISGDIKQVTVSYGDITQKVIISNSLGIYAKGARKRTRFYINVIAGKNDVIQTAYETAGGSYDFEMFKSVDIETLVKKAGERSVMMLEARHAPSGKMPVVIMSEAGGTLIHEACGHGLEADFIFKKTSVYRDKIGQKVASNLITVIDDATIPGYYGSYEFDDEGTPAQRKVLIENGILKGYMSDTYNANLLNIHATGNGRRESFHTKPQPRMTNTYIERGQTNPQEIIESIKEGLLVKKLGGGQVNVTNGDFVFDVQESFLIKNGEIKEPVRGAMLIGNGPKILQDIDMVGNDLNFIIGTCGKGDHAPVTDAMPTIRIPEIVVGGRE